MAPRALYRGRLQSRCSVEAGATHLSRLTPEPGDCKPRARHSRGSARVRWALPALTRARRVDLRRTLVRIAQFLYVSNQSRLRQCSRPHSELFCVFKERHVGLRKEVSSPPILMFLVGTLVIYNSPNTRTTVSEATRLRSTQPR